MNDDNGLKAHAEPPIEAGDPPIGPARPPRESASAAEGGRNRDDSPRTDTESRRLPRQLEPTQTMWRYERMQSRFRKPPAGAPNTVPVYVNEHGKLHEASDKPRTRGEWFREAITATYIVDSSAHVASIEISLPTADEGGEFTAHLAVTWKVSEPVKAVENGINDAGAIYRPYLERRLSAITREHEVAKRRRAEDRIYAELLVAPLSLPQGLEVTIESVRLVADGPAAQLAQAEQKHKVALLRQAQSHELKRRKDEFDRAMESARTKEYLEALKGGQDYLIALKLSSAREDVDQVIQLIMKQRQLDFDSARGTLQAILDANLANRRDVADIMARATNLLAEHLTNPSIGSRGPQASDLRPVGPNDDVLQAIEDGNVIDVEAVSDDDDDDDDDASGWG